jgi:mannose-6-phosphate isomerase-like protein (cupin superfamily)
MKWPYSTWVYEMYPTDMRPKLVAKQWGMETWFVNREYCGKRLIFAADHRCSVHYHKDKHETFLVDRGRFHLEIWKPALATATELKFWYKIQDVILEVGDTYEIQPGVGHRMTAIGGNASLIEFSTHHEDEDSYRIETGQAW